MDPGIKLEKKVIQRYFDNNWNYWHEVYEKESPTSTFHKYEMMKRKLVTLNLINDLIKEGHKLIIDIGCGTGIIIKKICGLNNLVIGVDISFKMLLETKKKVAANFGKSVFLVRCDAEYLPFRENIFNILIGLGLIEYISNERKFYAELKRTAKNNATGILSFPNLIKVSTLLDPYTYFIRIFKYLKSKMKIKEIHSDGNIYDPFLNEDFSNKRFNYYGLKNDFTRENFLIENKIAVGFGPLRIWKHNLFSHNLSQNISEFLERASHRIGIIKYFSNRFVFKFLVNPSTNNSKKNNKLI